MKNLLLQFISDNVLGDPLIHRKYTLGKCLIPSGKFEIAYRKERNKAALRKILLLVLFLNHAKINNLVDGYPPLFVRHSDLKSTKDVLESIWRNCGLNKSFFTAILERRLLTSDLKNIEFTFHEENNVHVVNLQETHLDKMMDEKVCHLHSDIGTSLPEIDVRLLLFSAYV